MGAPYIGSVYVYTFDGTQWTPNQRLLPSPVVLHTNFSTALAFDGTTALVGAPGITPGTTYVFGSGTARRTPPVPALWRTPFGLLLPH